MEVYLGVPAADGVGIGTAFVIPDVQVRAIPQHHIKIDQLNAGWKRFEQSVESVKFDLNEHLDTLSPDDEKDKVQREVFETYILMLEDPVFLEEVKAFYESQLFNIEYTIQFKSEEYATKLRNAGNEYLAERAKDITDVFGRVLDDMLDIHPFDISNVPDGSVIVANSLSSADTIILSKSKIAGLALTEGGVSSHVVILARNYGIPTVVGLNHITKNIKNGQTVIVDGNNAEVLESPDKSTIDEYKEKIRLDYQFKKSLKAFNGKPAVTKDGEKFTLLANIGTPEEAEIALSEGADGIGLFRTEFLYMSSSGVSLNAAARSFSEEVQFNAYKKVLQIMGDKPVTIRTLDAGGDKVINAVDIPLIDEKNPLMGLRAVRLSLEYPQVFKTQIRALYRASVFGNLRILLPLISSIEQVRECNKIIQEVKNQLKEEKIPFNEKVPVGIMVETAAAAICSDCMAKECDFFSIGTNDLTQYTLGVDRENQHVTNLYNEFNLAVLRLIDTTVKSAEREKISISVCGEMAGRQECIKVLAGMGIRNLSMSPKLINRTKEFLSNYSVSEFTETLNKYLSY